MRLSRLLPLAALAAVLALPTPVRAQTCLPTDTYCASFDTDAEGWGTDSDPVTFQPSGGNPGGHVLLDVPLSAAVGVLELPVPLPGAYRQTVSFDAYAISGETDSGYPVVAMYGQNDQGDPLSIHLDPLWTAASGQPGLAAGWARYSAPITNEGAAPARWIVVVGPGVYRPATEAEIQRVLNTLQLGGLLITGGNRADRSSWTLSEMGLDNVVIRAEADTSGPAVALIPSAETVVSGQQFEIDVVAGRDSSVTDLFGASFEVGYDGLQTLFVEFVPDPDFGSCDADPNTEDLVTSVTPQAASVAIAVSRRADRCPTGASGEVRLGHLVFEVPLAVPGGPAAFPLDDLEAIDAKGARVPLTAAGTRVQVVDGVVVWPGDTDANGTVAAADLLSIGSRFGVSGPARQDEGYPWAPVVAPFWDDPVATHADANGDGEVDEADVLAVGVNYGRMTEDGVALRTSSAPLATVTVQPQPVGTEVPLDVVVATDGALGVAATLSLPPGLDAIDVVTGGWLDDGDVLTYTSAEAGVVDAAATRKRGAALATGEGAALTVRLRVAAPMAGPVTVAVEALTLGTPDGTAPAEPGTVRLGDVQATDADDWAAETTLGRAFPNPAATTASVRLALAQAGPVRATLYDALGRRVATLTEGPLAAGDHTLAVPVGSLPAGAYVVRVEADGAVHAARLTVAR